MDDHPEEHEAEAEADDPGRGAGRSALANCCGPAGRTCGT